MSYDKIWYADNMQKFKVSDQSIYICNQYFKFDSIQPVTTTSKIHVISQSQNVRYFNKSLKTRNGCFPHLAS